MLAPIRFRNVKSEIRVLGVDDCAFQTFGSTRAMVIGVVFRGGLWLDGVMRTAVAVDGRDATERITNMVKSSTHYRQLRLIMLDSITVAGFNIVNICQLFGETKLPVIALTREKPSNDKVKKALRNLPDWEERWKAIKKAGELVETRVRRTPLFMHLSGISTQDAEKIVRITSTRANFPEPLRVAHILASGICQDVQPSNIESTDYASQGSTNKQGIRSLCLGT